MPGYLLFSYKRHLYAYSPISPTIDFLSIFHCLYLPFYPRILPSPTYTPSIFTTSADRWSVNRTPSHPTASPVFLSVLIFDVYSVHHCSNRFPPSSESTSSRSLRHDTLCTHIETSPCFYFYRIAALFRIVLLFLLFPSVRMYISSYTPLPVVSHCRFPSPDRYSFYLRNVLVVLSRAPQVSQCHATFSSLLP